MLWPKYGYEAGDEVAMELELQYDTQVPKCAFPSVPQALLPSNGDI